MENVRIELYLGEGATGAQCTISSAGSGVGSVGGIEGSWAFEPRKQVRPFLFCNDLGTIQSWTISKILRWDIPNMHSSGSWVLRGSWTSKYGFFRNPRLKNVLIVSFPGRRFRVRHMHFRSTLRFLRAVSRLSRLTKFGFRVRHTRCTRACGQ